MKISLIISTVVLSLVSCAPPAGTIGNAPSEESLGFAYGTVQQYGGNVGSKFAMFQLTWQADGAVVGTYHHPSDPNPINYQLRGENTDQGELVLLEYTKGKQTAIITLKKSISGELITWSGKMINSDGRVIPVSLTRRSS
jgi:hypothetical protein